MLLNQDDQLDHQEEEEDDVTPIYEDFLKISKQH